MGLSRVVTPDAPGGHWKDPKMHCITTLSPRKGWAHIWDLGLAEDWSSLWICEGWKSATWSPVLHSSLLSVYPRVWLNPSLVWGLSSAFCLWQGLGPSKGKDCPEISSAWSMGSKLRHIQNPRLGAMTMHPESPRCKKEKPPWGMWPYNKESQNTEGSWSPWETNTNAGSERIFTCYLEKIAKEL